MSTQYWVVPATAAATLAAVQAQLMPSAQAVQAVNKAYVDQAIAALGGGGGGSGGYVPLSGGTMTGPLTLSGDPTTPLMAADRQYVDSQIASQIAASDGASLDASVSAFAGELTGKQVGGLYQVDQFAGSDIGAKLTACVAGLSAPYGGICDARNFTGSINMAATVTISTPNTTVLLPCATMPPLGSLWFRRA